MYAASYKRSHYTFENGVEQGDFEYFDYAKLTWDQTSQTDYGYTSIAADEQTAYAELKEYFVDVDNVEAILQYLNGNVRIKNLLE